VIAGDDRQIVARDAERMQVADGTRGGIWRVEEGQHERMRHGLVVIAPTEKADYVRICADANP
jgi:hypothetical protein